MTVLFLSQAEHSVPIYPFVTAFQTWKYSPTQDWNSLQNFESTTVSWKFTFHGQQIGHFQNKDHVLKSFLGGMLAETRLHGRAVDCLQHKSVSRISSRWCASWPCCLFLGVHAWLMLFNTDFFHWGKAVSTSCGQLIAFWISCSLGRAVTVLLAARCSNMNCLLRMLFQWNIPSYCNWLVMPTVHWSTTHFHLVKALFFPRKCLFRALLPQYIKGFLV